MCMNKVKHFLAKATVRLVEKLNMTYAKINLYRLRGEFKSIGANAVIENSCSFMNPQCMTIGDDFTARSGLKLRAYTSYEDIEYNPVIRIGNNVHFAVDVTINCLERIEIGNHSGIGANSKLMDHMHGVPDYTDLQD